MILPESPKNCPMDALLRLLKGHWTPYILWTLRHRGPLRFGALKDEIAGVSAKILTDRLRLLQRADLIYRQYQPTIPPRVTYGLTDRGAELGGALDPLYDIACRWRDEGAEPPSASPS